jgi:hypothetical protein
MAYVISKYHLTPPLLAKKGLGEVDSREKIHTGEK